MPAKHSSLPEISHSFFIPGWSATRIAPIREQVVTCIGASLGADSAEECRHLRPFTSTAEQIRAAEFLQPADAARHLLGRALLRTVLARELGKNTLPATLPTNPWGKPGLPGSGFEFSISHAGNAVWLAITRQTALGIDVESVTACSDPYLLADMLHPEERADIHRCSDPQDASRHFLRCWTRKEAVSKALGRGLSCPLDSFRVATDAQTTNWLHHAPPADDAKWTCSDLPCSADYHVSLAAMAGELTITCHSLGLPNARLL